MVKQCDRRTDRRTPHDGIGRVCTALRGKSKYNEYVKVKEQEKLNMHIIFESVLILFTNKWTCCLREAARCFVSSLVSFDSTIVELLLVTSASDLLLRTIKFCFFLFVVVVHAGCDKQRFTYAWRSVR